MVDLIDENGIRIDGRKLDEMRPIKIEVDVVENADGSAYIEFGGNKIIAAVYGPREVHPKWMMQTNKAILRCTYHMSPFSTDTRKNPAPSRREKEISKVIREALEPAIILEDYPRTAIDVFIEILQSDGGSRCAGVTVASVALSDAGINMRDIVSACAAGKIDGKVVLDLSDIEDQKGQADMPIAILPNLNEVTLLQLDGIITPSEFKDIFNLATSGAKKLYEIQKDSLLKKYFGKDATVQEVSN